nr:uncharacterized protein LOC113806316 isoform X1 [Penaeus vannamei]
MRGRRRQQDCKVTSAAGGSVRTSYFCFSCLSRNTKGKGCLVRSAEEHRGVPETLFSLPFPAVPQVLWELSIFCHQLSRGSSSLLPPQCLLLHHSLLQRPMALRRVFGKRNLLF